MIPLILWNKTRNYIYYLGQSKSIEHNKDTNSGQFIPYAESSYIGEPYFDYGEYEDGKMFDRNKKRH